jgi:hypothetical protein
MQPVELEWYVQRLLEEVSQGRAPQVNELVCCFAGLGIRVHVYYTDLGVLERDYQTTPPLSWRHINADNLANSPPRNSFDVRSSNHATRMHACYVVVVLSTCAARLVVVVYSWCTTRTGAKWMAVSHCQLKEEGSCV